MNVDNHVGAGLACKAEALGFNKAVECEPIDPKPNQKLASGTFVKADSKNALCNVLSKSKGLLVNVSGLEKFWRDNELLAALDGHYVELCFRDFGSARNKEKALGQGRLLVGKLKKRGAGYRLTSGARDEFELRSPRDLVALGVVLGLTQQQAHAALGEL